MDWKITVKQEQGQVEGKTTTGTGGRLLQNNNRDRWKITVKQEQGQVEGYCKTTIGTGVK